jgi:hypothetical protein
MTCSNISKMIEGAGDWAGLASHFEAHLLADAGHDTRRLQL